MSKGFKKFLVWFLAVVIVFAAGMFLPFLSRIMPDTLDKVKVVSGKTDVSEFYLDECEEVYLAGDWEFFWNKHIVSDKNQRDAVPSTYVQVPASWTTYDINGEKLLNGGKASYRTYLENINTSSSFIVSVSNVAGSCKVYVDGECVFSNHSAPDFASEEDSFEIYSAPAHVKDGDNQVYEVVIEMECMYSSGLTSIPSLSTYSTYKSNETGSLAMRFFFIGITVFFAIAVLILSIMRRDVNEQFWLIVLCAAFTLRMLVSNEGYMVAHSIFGGVNVEIMMSLVYVSTYIIKLSMVMYIAGALRVNISQKMLVFISALFLLCAFVPYILYDYIYISTAYVWLQAIAYLVDVYLIYKIAHAIIKKRRFSVMYLVVYCITAAAIIIDNFYISGYISKNVSNFMPAACIAFVACMVIVHFADTVKLYYEAKRAAELTKELDDMNMTLMLSQIQPHFIYNALNTIKYLIKKDPKTAETAIVKFSNYLRANMDSLTQREPIPFTKELDHVKNYIAIESLRFGERLRIEYFIEEEDFSIPPLTIQPIVENAIKHGVNQKPDGGTVKISSYKKDGFIYVVIEDDGVGFDIHQKKDDGRSHVGINNIKTRLNEYMGAEVIIESTLGQGTCVTVKIFDEKGTEQ